LLVLFEKKKKTVKNVYFLTKYLFGSNSKTQSTSWDFFNTVETLIGLKVD